MEKHKREDGQMTGLAGEFFVAAELLKRRIQASITLGNAKHVDLLAYNSETRRKFTVQVKSLRYKTYFPVRSIAADHIYVFVILNEPGKAVQYFIISGKAMLADPATFAYEDPMFPGLYPKVLIPYENKWAIFFETEAGSEIVPEIVTGSGN